MICMKFTMREFAERTLESLKWVWRYRSAVLHQWKGVWHGRNMVWDCGSTV